MDWFTLLGNLGTFAVASGVLAWLVKKLFGIFLSKDLESFKMQLQLTAFEHQTRFAKLHEKRAEVIAELYGRLAYFNMLMSRLTNPLHPLTEEMEKQVGDAGNAFRDYYLKNRIYFDEEICKHLDSINGKFWNAWLAYLMSQSKDAAPKQSYQFLTQAFQTITQDIPVVQKEIEKAFRSLLEPRVKE